MIILEASFGKILRPTMQHGQITSGFTIVSFCVIVLCASSCFIHSIVL